MKEIQIKEHTNNIVSKANELIKAQAELSSTAHKMLCSVISMINVKDADFQEYALKREEYLKLIGSKSNNDEFLYEQAEQLMQKPFKIDGKLFNWCSMVDFKKMPGYIIFDVHPKLKPYLLQLKERGNFTQYQIVNILALRGDYSPRLYELIVMEWNQYKSYNPNAKSFTFELEVEELRENLGIPKSYLYNNIKSRIIEVTKKQLKERTNIQFTYEEYKLGRKVTRLIINVSDNNKGSNNFLASRKAFIAHIRKTFKPMPEKNLFPVIINTKSGDVKVNTAGEIYILGQEKKELDSKQSDKLWDWLYDLIKENPSLLSPTEEEIKETKPKEEIKEETLTITLEESNDDDSNTRIQKYIKELNNTMFKIKDLVFELVELVRAEDLKYVAKMRTTDGKNANIILDADAEKSIQLLESCEIKKNDKLSTIEKLNLIKKI